jgi:hypothetical protein
MLTQVDEKALSVNLKWKVDDMSDSFFDAFGILHTINNSIEQYYLGKIYISVLLLNISILYFYISIQFFNLCFKNKDCKAFKWDNYQVCNLKSTNGIQKPCATNSICYTMSIHIYNLLHLLFS